jgi:hypothetical protein
MVRSMHRAPVVAKAGRLSLSAEERTQQMRTMYARRVALLMATTLSIALMWASAAWAHSEPYCGHSSRTHDEGGVVHRTAFVGPKDGYHLTKTEHLKWMGTGYAVTGTWQGKELCRHHLT